MIIMHTHDTFKGLAEPNVPIAHARSHASLAREFLSDYCNDPTLLAVVQYHDEPFALWQQFHTRGRFSEDRLAALIENVRDWDLFLTFLVIDGSAAGKSRRPVRWFLGQLAGKVESRVTEDWLELLPEATLATRSKGTTVTWNWLRRLVGTTAACRAARDYLAARRPEWKVWTGIRSHRATEDDRTVVAVFFQIPGQPTRPARYELFAVSHDLSEVRELPGTPDSQYFIRGYK
jgi:hypothetical protein